MTASITINILLNFVNVFYLFFECIYICVD